MVMTPLATLKGNAWYYGVQCACQRLLALCEDCFCGKTDDTVLPVPLPMSVRCPCGVISEVRVLQKFKAP